MHNSDAQTVHVGKAVRLMMADLGLDAATVLRRAGLPSGLMHGEGSKITVDEFYVLWQIMTDEVGDPALPLKLADISSLDYFDPAFFAAMCSPDMNTAAKRLSEFKQLVGPFALGARVTNAETRITFQCKTGAPVPPTLALTELVFLVNFARRATRENITPVSVYLPEMVPDVELYERHFGCAVQTGDNASLVFRTSDARLPFLTHDDAMWSFFEPQLRKRIDEGRAQQSTKAQVAHVLAEAIPSGRANMEVVAREMALSKRTLQRRLSDEGTSWQEVLNTARQSLAKHYLSQTELGAAEISFLLGFEDPNSLFRAFKRWEGISPETWRSLHEEA